MLNDASTVGGGMPMMTALPPQSRTSTALRSTAGWPTQSKAHMTPDRVRSLMALRPPPPTPKTATGSPCWIFARLRAAPAPVRTPQPMRQAELSGTSSGMRMAWTSCTTVYSEKYDEPAKFQAGSPSTVKGWLMLPSDLRHHVGCPVLQALQMPQFARVLSTTC